MAAPNESPLPDEILTVRGPLVERLRMDGVVAAYVFGSAGEGRLTPLSDIDLAVIFDPALSADEQYDRQLKLMARLAAFFPDRSVDVLNLTDAAPYVAYKAVAGGRLLFCDDDRQRVRIVTRILLTYLDLKPLLERHAAAILRP